MCSLELRKLLLINFYFMLWCEIVLSVTPGDHPLIARVLIIEAREKNRTSEKGETGESGEGTCSPQSLLFIVRTRSPTSSHKTG